MGRLSFLALSAAHLGVSACAGSAPGASECEVGPEILAQSIAALVASAPACASDDDCVTVNTDLSCGHFSSSACGTVMHRAAAANWNPREVCQEIQDSSSTPKEYCQTQAACISFRPACIASVCSLQEN